MSRLISYIFLFGLSQGISAQNNVPQREKISLLFIGDIMCHDDQIKSAKTSDTGTYDFNDVFTYIKPEVSEADIAIANFEVTLDGPPYRGYPRFSSPAGFAAATDDAGINYFVTANNHSADRGKGGILNTIHKLDSLGILHTGIFQDQAGRDTLYPLVIEKKGASFALLNYSYGTNGIEVPFPLVVNLIDKDLIARDIEKAKDINPDIIILYLHWGTEYDTIPSSAQEEMAGYFLGLGVGLVIGSHPHVLQKMVWTKRSDERKDEIIAYSLGNFVSNQRRPGTDGGAMLRIEFEFRADSLVVTNAGYYLTWVYIPEKDGVKKYYILPCYRFENSPGFFDAEADYVQMNNFLKNSRRFLKGQNVNVDEISLMANTPEY